MLSQSSEYIRRISQSEKVWLNSGSSRADLLLKTAPVWLKVFPGQERENFFRSATAKFALISSLDVKGVFFGQLGEDQSVWLSPDASSPDRRASLAPADAFGGGEDYAAMLRAAESAGLETGADLAPVVGGRGPDFILQARNAGGHGGVYAMLPLTADEANSLPPAREEWETIALSPKTVSKLVERGVLPSAVRRENFPWASSGWAATGPVLGLDGTPRRWLYRFEKTPDSPVMLWQDPSGAARRILTAAIIRQTGIDGQTLTALRIGAWLGLEPTSPFDKTEQDNYAPGVEAAENLARQIHQYGGWAVQADPAPPEAVAEIVAGACDFCVDEASPALLFLAASRRDAAPLAKLYNYWREKKVPQYRLARGLNAWEDIPIGVARNFAGDDVADATSLTRAMSETPTDKRAALAELSAEWNLSQPGLAFLDLANFAGEPDSPKARRLAKLIRARTSAGLAQAELIEVSRPEPPVLCLLYRLPNGARWLAALNLDAKRREIVIDAPEGARRAVDPLESEKFDRVARLNRGKIALALDAGRPLNVIFKRN